ncbi:MAG: bifunctional phosphopantothenoylcysteine decarboxylase/phosphopantothenate--cysteine ligase CoaBC [Candidatus Lightella neohaematopini]|nr:bifunctional phosphopantothenoylcysteine decarboxylase/phosphopantothenate--cysteine ligase CoaBC [Candidatus Lightella neohaematopini]
MITLLKKRILLGISGSIAIYKVFELIRYLRKKQAIVRIVMTKTSKKLINKLSLQILSNYKVFDDIFDANNNNIIHIKLAKWADLILLAPATANIIAKISLGLADDLLSTICLATKAKIVIIPSMNNYMYRSPITQHNIQTLRNRGILVWGPNFGKQICGDIGLGSMLNPNIIIKKLKQYFYTPLKNFNIMITAGPTHELIDPVRFISNYSSGKMGFSIAYVAALFGANVTLISGPVNLLTPPGNIKRINVISALEMKQAVMDNINKQNIFIGCAAVSDYRITNFSSNKIAKKDNLIINLIKNPDIISEVSQLTKNRPYVIGFSAETNLIKERARKKLIEKKLDLICANNVSKNRFNNINNDYNELYLIWNNGEMLLSLNKKQILAKQLMKQIIIRYEKDSKH